MPIFTPDQYRLFDPLTSNSPLNLDRATKVICPITKRDLGPNEGIDDIMGSELDDVSGIWYNHISGEDDNLLPTISNVGRNLTISPGMCVIRNTFITINESVEIPLNEQDSYFDSHDYLLSPNQYNEEDELIINGGVEGIYTYGTGPGDINRQTAPGWNFDNINWARSTGVTSPKYEGLKSWKIQFMMVLHENYAGPYQYVGPLDAGELYKLTYALKVDGGGTGPVIVSVTDSESNNRLILNTHTEDTEDFIVYTKYFTSPLDVDTLRFECTDHVRTYYIDDIHLQKVTSNYWYHAVIRHNPDVDKFKGAVFGLVKARGEIDFDWSIYCILGTFKVSTVDNTSGVTIYVESSDDLYTDIYSPPYDSPAFEYRKVIHMPRIERTVVYNSLYPNSGRIPYVQVVNPAGHEMYLVGDEMNIYWNSRGLEETDKLRLDLFSLGDHVKTIATDLDAFSSGYSWIIDSTDESVDFCSIRLTTSGELRLSSTTNPTMVINPTMEITSPTSSDNWSLDSTESITFTSTGMNSRYVDIDLYKGENYLDTIRENLICYKGEYEWHIPSDYMDGDELITNSGVEGTYTEQSTNIYVPNGWSFNNECGATVLVNDVSGGEQYDGEKSFKTNFNSLPSDYAGPYQYISDLEVGEWYKLTYALKRLFGTVKVSVTNATSSIRLDLNTHDTVDSEWYLYTKYFRAIGAPISDPYNILRFECDINNASEFIIDNINLYKIFVGGNFKIRLTETTRPSFYVESDNFEISVP